uniref:Uncharacterized protein n=1 Tax=Panagrolaimus davidi TaxID=227884 RepID=A0A914Q1A2_9BILA
MAHQQTSFHEQNSKISQHGNQKTEYLTSQTNESAFIQESDTSGLPAEELERRAKELREQAQAALKTNEIEFQQAQQAQNAARIAAEIANAKTEQALTNQERGQQLLAEAGAQMIEAGARLQREATATQRQAPFNVHQQGEVRQTTVVSAAGQEMAAAAHDVQTFREVEHIPATTTTTLGQESKITTSSHNVYGQNL